MAYIELEHIEKLYQVGEVTITAVSDISFTVDKGEFVVVVGPSGAGKTTVLNILGGMDTATHGTITVDGQTISAYNAKELTAYRRFDIGFVFQFYNLVQNLTALENVELATQIAKSPLPPEEVLAHVGLSHRLHNFPSQLSGGEQQRVAIARALAKNETSPGHLPPTGDDGDRHHPQHRHRPHGRQGHPREERPGGAAGLKPPSPACGGDRVVTI